MRKRIWNIYKFYLCSVVGSGLTLSEQKKIMDKAGLDCSGLSAFDIHEYIIDQVQKETPFATRVEKALNNKFRQAINQYKNYSSEEWVQELSDCNYSRHIGETAWVSASCIDLDYTDAMNVFGELHIAAHEAVHNAASMTKKLEYTQQETEAIEKKYLKATRKLEEERQLVRELKSEKSKVSVCTSEKKRAITEPQELKEKLKKTRKKYEQSKILISQLQEEKKKKNGIIMDLSNEIENLRSQIKTIVAANCDSNCSECNAKSKPQTPCCMKKVLMVGGIEKFRSHYQNIAQEHNCSLEYHSGHCRDGEVDLSNKIGRCDFVLCPVDINSHAACLAVKKFCKKMNKDFHILNSSSISSIRKAIASSVSGNS